MSFPVPTVLSVAHWFEAIGIDPNRVIGMDVMLRSSKQGDEAGVNYTMAQKEDLIRTDSLLIKNLKTNKVLQIT